MQHPTLVRGSKEGKKTGTEDIFKEIIVENFPNMEENSPSSPAQKNPLQAKTRGHIKTLYQIKLTELSKKNEAKAARGKSNKYHKRENPYD